MKQRILVAVVGVPALLAVLCAAPDWATLALLMGLCIIASHELLAAVLPPERHGAGGALRPRWRCSWWPTCISVMSASPVRQRRG